MTTSQELCAKHEKTGDWTGVKMIGVCLDKENNLAIGILKRVSQWSNIELFGCGKSNIETLFGIEAVPFSVLVDKSGTIVWLGNPGTRDLENDITDLVNEREITVKAEQEEVRDN